MLAPWDGAQVACPWDEARRCDDEDSCVFRCSLLQKSHAVGGDLADPCLGHLAVHIMILGQCSFHRSPNLAIVLRKSIVAGATPQPPPRRSCRPSRLARPRPRDADRLRRRAAGAQGLRLHPALRRQLCASLRVSLVFGRRGGTHRQTCAEKKPVRLHRVLGSAGDPHGRP